MRQITTIVFAAVVVFLTSQVALAANIYDTPSVGDKSNLPILIAAIIIIAVVILALVLGRKFINKK